ncbi:MAG TPA: DNA primase [Pyrinomonadaceae bacterium]|nr:DNA primase [Pyrinomonadaceae bacterium]
MRYPQTFLDDLKRQADIVRVVQDYVQLKKKGANWMACCPFHKEKTPSFSVSPAKEIFYCFGCHKGGSVFNFVMEMERVSFPEAIKLVAEKSGVPLPKLIDDSRFEARRNEADAVIELNRWALEWWEQQLESSGEARIARDYLKRREITDETRKTFRMGYAPDSWDALSIHLRQKGATQDQIERSGLVVKKEEGGSYDRFRGRLIFPVMDIQGKPIAFGGRTLRDEDAKYINSPETAAYVKGRNLFGLNLTRDEIRRAGFVILVEGFLDLIVPYQFGVRNVVASLGTALTPDQARMVSRFARKVVVNYDGDNAGVQAAKKAIAILLAEDLEVKILVLPDGSDPDEFIRKSGVSEYQQQRGLAQSHIQFVIDQAVRDRKLSNPADKEAAIDEVLPYIRVVRSRLQKREYFDIAMDSLRIGDATLRRELWHSIRQGTGEGARASEAVKATVRRPTIKPTVAEERLLGLVFANEGLRSGVLSMLQPEDYEDLATAPLLRVLLELENEHREINFDSLSEKLAETPELAELLPMLMMSESLHASNEHYTPEECVFTFRLMKLESRIGQLRDEGAMAEREGNTERVIRVSAEQTELAKRKSALLTKAEATQMEH